MSFNYPVLQSPHTKALAAWANTTNDNAVDHENRIAANEGNVSSLLTGFQGGEYTVPGAAGNLQPIGAASNTLITGWTTSGTGATAQGISYSSGVFTVTKAGIWLITASLRFSTAAGIYMFITKGGTTDQRLKHSVASGTLNLTISGSLRFVANETFRLWVWSSVANNVAREATNDMIPSLTAYRVSN